MSAPTLDAPEAPQAEVKQNSPALLGRSPQDTPAGWVNYVLLSFVLLIGFWPVYWAGIISTWKEDKVYVDGFPTWKPGPYFSFNWNLINGGSEPSYPSYDSVNFLRSAANSLVVVAVVVAGTLFFCSLAGFAFAKLRFRGRDPLFYFVVLTLTIPAQLGIVGLYQIMDKIGWIGTLFAVTVPSLVSAFGVFYMRQFIEDAIPDEIIESATVDGASTFRVYTAIVLPTLRPALGVLGLIAAVGAWNEYVWALVAVGGSTWQTIGPALHNLRAGSVPKTSIILTGSFLATIPVIILLFIAGRQIVRGIMDGAVKA
ncbi:MAG: carbohydrate ABC transporter permease [Demequina sp.]|nr:carbohydrate ABC transporter permease [Demequina sp.]